MNSVDTTTATRNKDLSSPTPKILPGRWTGIRRYLTFGFAGGLSALSLGVAIQYGASIGSATGTATTVLLIALGVLTEAGKALGFYNTAASLKSRSFLASVGWSAVALSCLAYSVAADLHVSASSRSDATAQRAQVIQAVKDARFDRETASVALRSIESQASFNQRIDRLLKTKGANRCLRIDGPISRATCKQVELLRSEKVAAARRTRELEAKIARADQLVRKRESNLAGVADASADTLSKVLAKFGFGFAPSDVALVLVFLPVLIIEFCGSLAWLLAGSIRVASVQAENGGQVIDGDLAKPPKTSVPSVGGQGVASPQDDGEDLDGNAKGNVIRLLKQNGGVVKGGQRGLAAMIGASRTRLQQVIDELVSEGRVMVTTGRSGTTLQLARA